ncbi:MAG: calcium/sodium antiporter [Bacteroidaceae bacterium]|nr:calcium/sodium antiporter [Bacteroidaceae bacterium]
MFLYMLYALAGATLVLVGADRLTDGAASLAVRLGISEMVIGLTIVAFGTSLPEFIVSFLACMSSDSSRVAISVSNIVGSNLFNTLLIAGASAAAAPIACSAATVHKDIPLCLLASVVLSALTLDGLVSGESTDVLTRGDGIVLLCFFAIFMAYSISLARQKQTVTRQTSPMSSLRITLFIVLGLAALIGGGELFVEGACGIARLAGVSETIIGLTLVAGGTSLPELATSIVSARKGQSALAIGNVVGSNIFNIFFILGICASVETLPAAGLTTMDFTTLIASALLLWAFSCSSRRLSRWEGWVMMLAYALYLGWLTINSIH